VFDWFEHLLLFGYTLPIFNKVVEFFCELRQNYLGVRIEKLQSLQDFQHKPHESLRKAYAQMHRLIMVTQGVTEAQIVQFWYGILNKEFKCQMQDVILLQTTQPALASVF